MDPVRVFLLVMLALAVLIVIAYCASSKLARIAREARERAEGHMAWRKASLADLEADNEAETEANAMMQPDELPAPRRAGLRIVRN